MTIPGSANPLLLKSAAAAGPPVQIERSLRFNSSDSGFCSRTPAVAGNRRTWTWAGWVKRSKLGEYVRLFNNTASGNAAIQFMDSDKLRFFDTSISLDIQTTQVFRDASAWYHLVIVLDTVQGTPSNRAKIYVNGVQVTTLSTATYPSPSVDGGINNNNAHQIGSLGGSSEFFNGYLADIHFIDGQALTPSSFTEVSATTGQLIPKAYAGTYTGNSFWLKFNDNSAATATTLGKDSFLLGNNWTPNNLSVTAGAGNDSLVDTPTSYGTDTGAGGEVRGNYCTWNPLAKGTDVTLANGNLDITSSSSAGNTLGLATFGLSSGKWYWEITCTGSDPRNGIGIAKQGVNLNSWLGSDALGWSYVWGGQKGNNGSQTSYGASFTANDVIGVAFDADNGTLTFYKNGSSQGQAFSGLSSGPYFPALADDSGGGVAGGAANFGQRPFAYTAPSGFKALCDTNLGAPLVAKPNTVFDVKLYDGNGSTNSITGLGFSPDLVWLKNRSGGGRHNLYDVIRDRKALFSDGTDAELSLTAGNDFGTFDSTGFTLLTPQSTAINNSGQTFVAWAWDAGTSTVSNTQGSITSQVRANASAGFSVVTFNSGGSNGEFSVGHGLGVAPRLIIMKSRTRNGGPWWVHHLSATDTTTKYLQLSATAAVLDNGGSGSIWGAALPTSTVFGFSVGVGRAHLQNEDIVSYCFAPVAGYSSFGSYTGNGSADGPFVYTGFRPRWVMVKAASGNSVGSDGFWGIFDAARSGYNGIMPRLQAESSNQEDIHGAANFIDILSNGFKVRVTGTTTNNSGTNYIYIAFAENPFQYARAR